jgi:ferredoxin-NADP reductase
VVLLLPLLGNKTACKPVQLMEDEELVEAKRLFSSHVGVSLGILLVLVAGANVLLMLRSGANRARQVRAHRLGGYLFLALFAAMFYFMSRRVSGLTHGFSLVVVIHSALAFLLVPLLLLKIVIARRHRHHTGALLALGLAIFSVSFLLVTITSFPVLWAADLPGKLPAWADYFVLGFIVVAIAALFLRRPAAAALPDSVPTGANTPSPTAPALPVSLQPDKRKSLLLLLSRIQDQTHDAKTLRFLLPQRSGFEARPGQFLTFDWIVEGKHVARSYSICSSPLQKGYLEITAKRAEAGYVSAFLNQRAQVGLMVEARGPFGRFYFDEVRHSRIVLIAGGSGITPMISMLRYINDLGLTTDVTLLYFVRTPRDVLFASELEQLRAELPKFRYQVIVSRPDTNWKGSTGHVSSKMLEQNVHRMQSVHFFLCGPAGLMESATSILRALRIPDEQIRQESFGSRTTSPGEYEPMETGAKLELARSRQSCNLLAGKTLLETAEANGIHLPSSCRQGLCGTCALRVLRGKVHMDSEDGLSPEQKDQGFVLACVSRAIETVIVDL